MNRLLAARLLAGLFLLLAWSGEAVAQPGLRILVSGFEPFGGLAHNPTAALVGQVNSLPADALPGVTLRGVLLPVTYGESWQVLERAIDDFQPDYLLAFGFAPGSRAIRLERWASNLDEGGPDNRGKRQRGAIVAGGPQRYASELPLAAIARRLAAAGIAVSMSDDAGGYICNHIFYQARHYSAKRPGLRAGFIHVPDWPIGGEKGLESVLRQVVEVVRERTMKVAVLEFEPVRNDVAMNLARIASILETTRPQGIGCYLFPEMALSGLGYSSSAELLDANPEFDDDRPSRILADLAAEHRIYLGVGLPTLAAGAFFNSYRIFQPDGKIYTYHKTHLYGSDFGWSRAGESYPVLATPFGRIGVLICHDVVYPEAFVAYRRAGVELLVVGTNWIGDTPISRYLRPQADGMTILVSDRRGREDEILFKGNTGVLADGQWYGPVTLADKVRGIVCLLAGDDS